MIASAALVAVQAGGAGINSDGQTGTDVVCNRITVFGVVHGVATVTMRHTAVMERVGGGAQSKAQQDSR
jgi:hypothetical protein